MLEGLEISYNPDFGGILPEAIGKWSALREFHAIDVSYTGPLPSSLTKLTRLEYFDLRSEINDTIPDDIWKLSNLSTFMHPAVHSKVHPLGATYVN